MGVDNGETEFERTKKQTSCYGKWVSMDALFDDEVVKFLIDSMLLSRGIHDIHARLLEQFDDNLLLPS